MSTQPLTEQQHVAVEVLQLAKDQLLAANPYLAPAASMLPFVPSPVELFAQAGTDAQAFYFDANQVLARFAANHEAPPHDYAHTLLHCLFLHPFANPGQNQARWDLACDIAAESVAAELCGPRPGATGEKIMQACEFIRRDLQMTPLTAESVFELLKNDRFLYSEQQWRQLFSADDHQLWRNAPADPPAEESRADQQASEAESSDAKPETETDSDGEDNQTGESKSGNADDSNGTDGDSGKTTADNADDSGSTSEGNGSESGADGDSGRAQNASAESGNKADRASDKDEGAQGNDAGNKASANGKSRKSAWQDAAQETVASLKAQFDMPSGGWGKNLSGLFGNLRVPPTSYRKQTLDEFLRAFATLEETPQPSSDEFDYALYTYGFALYGNIPIIEPLETRDDKRIREFVVGIDVSGSVWGPIATRFAQMVQGVLCNEGLFSSRPRIRIMQCDTEIVAEDVIDTPKQMQQWIGNLRLYGGGGTDFRPVFRRVDELLERKEIENLNGVMYLTDGYGSYPERATPYKTAFILTPHPDENMAPNWALSFMLDEDDFLDIR